MNKILHKLNGGIKRSILLFYKDAFPQHGEQLPDDPEMNMLYPYCKGLGIDVGCGSRKTHPHALGVDLTPKGAIGKHGSENRHFSAADITASGDNLYMFADGVLDYVIARHNIEHYVDPIKAIKEWKRILKKGGIMGVVVPDDAEMDTIKIDPTHKHAFTQESFKRMLLTIGGFRVVKLKSCKPGASFICVAKKI